MRGSVSACIRLGFSNFISEYRPLSSAWESCKSSKEDALLYGVSPARTCRTKRHLCRVAYVHHGSKRATQRPAGRCERLMLCPGGQLIAEGAVRRHA
jgi:hypothetical protein